LKCSFSNQNESIQHLYFDCYLARNIWRTIFFTFYIGRPYFFNHITGTWESNKGIAYKKKILIGIVVMFWSIWLYCYDIIFNHKPVPSILQVIFIRDYCKRKNHTNKSSMPVNLLRWWLYRSSQAIDDDPMLELQLLKLLVIPNT
jgi:hypothetical protein